MKKYVERMATEKKELEDKITKAERAISAEPYDMTNQGKELLLKQIVAMKQYRDILQERYDYEAGRC